MKCLCDDTNVDCEFCPHKMECINLIAQETDMRTFTPAEQYYLQNKFGIHLQTAYARMADLKDLIFARRYVGMYLKLIAEARTILKLSVIPPKNGREKKRVKHLAQALNRLENHFEKFCYNIKEQKVPEPYSQTCSYSLDIVDYNREELSYLLAYCFMFRHQFASIFNDDTVSTIKDQNITPLLKLDVLKRKIGYFSKPEEPEAILD